MKDQRLVLVCGCVACLKTTLSLAIAPRLCMSLLATYGMGPFDNSTAAKLAEDRETRYGRLFEIAKAYLSLGLSLWVDGNFPSRAWRSAILDLARSCQVTEACVVYCYCSEPWRLEERFASRRADFAQPDAKATRMLDYEHSLSQFETILPSEFEGIASWEVLLYDSCRRNLGRRDSPTPLGSEIVGQMLHRGFLNHV